MFDLIPLTLFFVITVFHVYMGFGGQLNYDYILPKVNGKDLPFHTSMAIPVAICLGLSTSCFGYKVGLLNQSLLGSYNDLWLLLTAYALFIRGCFGLIVFHIFNRLIDNTLFKVWDLRVYTPLTLFLGFSSFKALGLI